MPLRDRSFGLYAITEYVPLFNFSMTALPDWGRCNPTQVPIGAGPLTSTLSNETPTPLPFAYFSMAALKLAAVASRGSLNTALQEDIAIADTIAATKVKKTGVLGFMVQFLYCQSSQVATAVLRHPRTQEPPPRGSRRRPRGPSSPRSASLPILDPPPVELLLDVSGRAAAAPGWRTPRQVDLRRRRELSHVRSSSRLLRCCCLHRPSLPWNEQSLGQAVEYGGHFVLLLLCRALQGRSAIHCGTMGKCIERQRDPLAIGRMRAPPGSWSGPYS